MINTLKKIRLPLTTFVTSLIVTLILTASPVKADDTEVYISSGNTANVLLIFDLSGSMANPPDVSTTKTKYEILLESLTTVLGNLKDKTNLRIGLSYVRR